jgi:hypothetical protein
MRKNQSARCLAAALALLLLGTGCFTVGTMQEAHTVGKGNSQSSAEPQLWGMAIRGDKPLMTHSGAFARRWGVKDDVDIGIRAGAQGVELLTKFQLTPPTGVVFSVAPSIGGTIFPVPDDSSPSLGGLVNMVLPVLIGLPVGKHQLVLSPSIRDYLVFASGGSTSSGAANLLCIGASVGFAIRVNDSFRILPEVAAVMPVLGSAAASNFPATSTTAGTSFAFYTVGLGFLWGRSR